MCIYISTLYVHSPLLTSGASQSGTGTVTDNGGNDVIVSQKVYGELVIIMSFVRAWVWGVFLPLQIIHVISYSLGIM